MGANQTLANANGFSNVKDGAGTRSEYSGTEREQTMARMGNGLRISKVAAAAPAVIVLAALVSHAAAAEAAQVLSEKPPRSAAKTEFEARTSTIEPSLTIAYDVLADAANAAADRFSGP